MAVLFRATKALESKIDDYLDDVSQGVILFTSGVKNFMNNKTENFNDQRHALDKLEHKADNLRRHIENDLYQHSLIPEHRGDVLGLLETIDDVIDTAKETLDQFDVEKPFIPQELGEKFAELAETSGKAAESVILASRAFFKEVNFVKDHLHKVYFYEKEADKQSDRIKRIAFSSENLELSQKNHLRYFADNIDSLADKAENVADRLAIYTIKRTI